MAKKPQVKCKFCGQSFYREDCEWVKIKNRYAHKSCADGETEVDNSRAELIEYICKLFSVSTLPIKISKQLKQYIEQGYTYKGIHKALKYWYEVKNGSIEKANGGIGIVAYIYNDSQLYWQAIWEAREKNKEEAIMQQAIPIREVRISNPKREPMRHLKPQFTFLDEEVQSFG